MRMVMVNAAVPPERHLKDCYETNGPRDRPEAWGLRGKNRGSGRDVHSDSDVKCLRT